MESTWNAALPHDGRVQRARGAGSDREPVRWQELEAFTGARGRTPRSTDVSAFAKVHAGGAADGAAPDGVAGGGSLRSSAADLVAFVKAELAAPQVPTTRQACAMALTQQQARDVEDMLAGKIGLTW
jgi:hypothetical protein